LKCDIIYLHVLYGYYITVYFEIARMATTVPKNNEDRCWIVDLHKRALETKTELLNHYNIISLSYSIKSYFQTALKSTNKKFNRARQSMLKLRTNYEIFF